MSEQAASEAKLRKLSIVLEETGELTRDEKGRLGRGFNVYLEGDTERLSDQSIPDDDLSAAEFWGAKLFEIVAQVLRQSGAVKNEINKNQQGH